MARKAQRSAKPAPRRRAARAAAPAAPTARAHHRRLHGAARRAAVRARSASPRSPSRAGVSLAELRAEFGSTLAILAAHIKEIDRKVLAGGDADMAEEPPRERLFDVLMRRLEALAPYKEAVRSLLRSARRNPRLALALNAHGGALAALDADRGRHRRVRPARHGARAGRWR